MKLAALLALFPFACLNGLQPAAEPPAPCICFQPLGATDAGVELFRVRGCQSPLCPRPRG